MKVISIILGVIMIICGFSCALSPGATFLASGYMIAIMFLVDGIFGLVRAFSLRHYGLEFAMSILGTIIGVFAIFRPESTLGIDAVIIYVAASFFVIRGIVAIVIALNLKKVIVGNNWIWGVVFGVMAIIVGIYSFIHPIATALAIGILIGIYFIESGIDLIAVALCLPSADEY